MKAVVLETRGRKAAILLKDGTVRIARGRYTVGEVIDCDVAPRPTWRQWTAAAAAMVALLGVSAGLWVDRNYIAYAEISLDVNPSIVYTLNKRDRVLSVRAANGDGAQIVEALKQGGVRFKPIEDAVDETMAMLEDAGYLDAGQEDYVLLNVSSDDEARREDLAGQVESAMGRTKQRDSTMEYRIDRSDRKTAREAADNGMSAGRYAAWQEKAAEEEKEDFREMPVREIMGGEREEKAPTDEQPDRDRGEREEAAPDAPSDKGQPDKAAPDAPSDVVPPGKTAPDEPSDVEPPGKTMPDEPSDVEPPGKTAPDAPMDKEQPEKTAPSEKKQSEKAAPDRDSDAAKSDDGKKEPSGSPGEKPNQPSKSDRGSEKEKRPAGDSQGGSGGGGGKGRNEPSGGGNKPSGGGPPGGGPGGR